MLIIELWCRELLRFRAIVPCFASMGLEIFQTALLE
jgi:hypothetical protein